MLIQQLISGTIMTTVPLVTVFALCMAISPIDSSRVGGAGGGGGVLGI